MTGDYTRHTFRPEQHFSGVRLQQGRVQIDADWNEAVDIALHRERTALRDVVGPTGVPEDAPGFALTPVAAGSAADLAIGPGRAYVGGVLVEHVAAGPTTLEKVSGSGANTVWQVIDGPRLAAGQWVGPAADPQSNLTTVAEILAPQDGDGGLQRLKLAKGIGGGTQIVAALATYGAQPNLPDPPPVQAPGPYLAYLDVWEREITALEDPALKDVALGGPDTALRTKVVWQVGLLALQPLIDAGDLPAPPICKWFGPDWSPDGDAERARLAARTNPTEETPDPCVLPSAGGYRSLENRLYRVEVQVGGTAGQDQVFVKWSRDNAIHRSRLLDVEDGSLVVEETGKDAVTAFKPGEWLEVLDEGRILRGEAGFFVELGEVVGTRLGIKTILDPLTLQPLIQDNEPNADILPTTGLVRRWEGGPPAEAKAGEWLALENGIEVQIGAGLAHAGDHWLIPARTLTASIEWPLDAGSGEPEFLPALGIVHRYMSLAIVELAADGTWTVSSDCRPVFPPLTRLESFFYLGGDGQEAMPVLVGAGQGPLVMLDQPFRAGVARGRTPVEGRLVRFRVTDASEPGRLAPAGGTDPADVVSDTGAELILRTGGDGVANAAFSVDRRRHVHHVLAELLDASDPPQADPVHLPIRFTASTSVAAEVAYDPDDCPYQLEKTIKPGTATTVQAALDKLCPRLELVLLGGDGQELCAGERAPAPLTVGLYWGRQPLKGVRLAFKVVAGDAAVAPAETATDEKGIASALIVAGQKTETNGGVVVVNAIPLDPPVPAAPEMLTFTARFVNARCIYLGPDICPDGQAQTGSNTVAALIDFLCKTGGGQDPGMHVTGVFRANPQENGQLTLPLGLDEVLDPGVLVGGLRFDFDMQVDPAALKSPAAGLASRPVGAVIIDLPWPVATDERFHWWMNDAQPRDMFAFRPTRLDAAFAVAADLGGRENQAIIWTPSRNALRWLASIFFRIFETMGLLETTVEARAVLYGNRIWSQRDSRFLLDGDLFVDPRARSGFTYPTGDGRRGGDLVLPFLLGRPHARLVAGGNAISLIPVRESAFFKPLSAAIQKRVGRALDAALDRPALKRENLVPSDVALDENRAADPEAAGQAMQGVTLETGAMRVLVHSLHGKLLGGMKKAIEAATPIRLTPVATTTQDPAAGILRRLTQRDPGVDAVLVDAATLEAVQADPALRAKVGAALLQI